MPRPLIRTRRIEIRMSPDEYRRLKAAADRSGMGLGPYMIEAALHVRLKAKELKR